MTAKLATQAESIVARAEEAVAMHDGSTISRSPSDRTQVGSMEFESGYLSPYFITDPERMEVAFAMPTFSFAKRKSIPGGTCSRYWSRSPSPASRCS